MVEVPLVDLEVIARYSLAIRQETAPADELLAALQESIDLVRSLAGGAVTTTVTPVPDVGQEGHAGPDVDVDGPAFAGVGDDAAFGGLPSPEAEADLWPEPAPRVPRRARRSRT